MTPDRMRQDAAAVLGAGLKRLSFWAPHCWKPPKGFPRRELLCCPYDGGSMWSVDAARLLKFLGPKE